MTDISDSIARDSDIKFECRMLLFLVAHLPKELEAQAKESIRNIVRIENERLDALRESVPEIPGFEGTLGKLEEL